MSDHEYEEVTTESWGSRIGESIKGILAGVVMFLASFVLLFWNEGRAVQTEQSLKEGQGAVVTVDSAKVDKSNDGKLVHFTGTATTKDVLTDDTFGVKATAIKLVRKVEMYQWVEKKKTTKKKKAGGKVVKKTKYKYKKAWSEKHIDSSSFKKKKKHRNPSSMPYKSKEYLAKKVNVGAYELPKGLIEKISGSEDLKLNAEELEKALTGKVGEKVRVKGNMIYIGKDPENPKVGDIRVTFSVVRPQEVSVIAQQTGNTLQPYQTKAGDKLFMLMEGKHSSQEMFKNAMETNKTMTWILRFLGWLLMFMGLAMVLEPLAVLLDVLPFLGDLLRVGIKLVSGIIAFVLSAITIAIAWLFYRPLLAIGLIVVALGVFYGVYYMGRKKKGEKQQEAEQ